MAGLSETAQGNSEATHDGAHRMLSREANIRSFLPLRAREWGIALIATLPIAAIAIAKLWGGIGIDLLTRDPIAIFGGPPFAGVLSQLGGMIWASAATLWLAMAVLTRHVDPVASRFAVAMAALTTYLALDDMFMLHEAVFPLMLGIPEKVVLASIAVVSCACTLVFRQRFVGHRPALFGLAIWLLAASVVLDMLDGRGVIANYNVARLAEDGFKWLGICAWYAYAFSSLRRSLTACRSEVYAG